MVDWASFCHCLTYEAAIDYAPIRPFSPWTRRLTQGSTYAVVRSPCLVPVELRDLRHGLDADDALDREVRLVRETTREVIRAELVRRYQGIRDQELRPLVEQTELRNQVRMLLDHLA